MDSNIQLIISLLFTIIILWYSPAIFSEELLNYLNTKTYSNFIMNLYRVIDREVIQFDFVAHTDKKCDFDEEIEELGGTIYHCPDYRIVNHITYCKWWKKFFNSHPKYKIVHSHLDSSVNIHLRIAKNLAVLQ